MVKLVLFEFNCSLNPIIVKIVLAYLESQLKLLEHQLCFYNETFWYNNYKLD